MTRNTLTASLFTLPALAVVLALPGQPDALAQVASITSDKPDYAPGEVAILSGGGFEPGEPIDISISIDDPESGAHIADYDWTVEMADDDGAFATTYVIPWEAANMTLTATAMGYVSGKVATVVFTDAPQSTYSVSSNSMSLSGNQVTISTVVSGGTSGTPVTGATAVGTTSDGVNFALVLTEPTGNGNGTYVKSFTATMGRRYQWNGVDVSAHNEAHGKQLGGPLSVTAPPCSTTTTISCPSSAIEGDTSIGVSAAIDSSPSGGFVDPGDPSTGTVTFTVVRNSDNSTMGTLSGVAVASGSTSSQTVTVAALTPGSYSVSADFIAASVANGSGGIRYAGSASSACSLIVLSSCDEVTSVAINAPGDESVYAADDCDSTEVSISASADGTSPSLSYYLDNVAQGGSTFTVSGLGAHTIYVEATNDCTDTPVSSDPITVYVKAATTLVMASLPAEYITGTCDRNVSATLSDSCGTPLSGMNVEFTANGDPIGCAQSGDNGVASISWNSYLAPGNSIVYAAEFAVTDSYFGASAGPSAAIPVHYNFVGFGSPLNNSVTTKVKRGSAVPVKFQLFDCNGNAVTTGTHSIGVYYSTGTAPIGDTIVNDTGSSGDNGTLFRWSAPNWIFNLKTSTSWGANNTYRIVAALDDGTTRDGYISNKP